MYSRAAVPEAHSLVEDRGISVTSYDGYPPPLPSFQNTDLGDLTKHRKSYVSVPRCRTKESQQVNG